ncbi:MAG: PKD domain-containing protein [Flavobacteriales bacterium]
MRNKLLSLAVILFICSNSYSTHFAGGNIYYDCLGNNQYRFWVEFTLDCLRSTSAQSSVTVTASNSCGLANPTISLPIVDAAGLDVSQVCPSELPNTKCAMGAAGTVDGRRRYLFSGVVTLQPCNTWTFGLGLNARNNAVVNLSTNGTMYLETTLNSVTDSCNNSVRYTGVQNPYVCVGSPASYNFGAFDPDGDSLSFTLIAAKMGAGVNYTYTAPYTATVPIQAMTIDSTTGTINFFPTTMGSFVVVVQVNEYDDSGRLVGTTLRDIQIVVQNCLGNKAPDVTATSLYNLQGAGVIAGPRKLEVCEGDVFCVDFPVIDSNAMDTLTLTSSNISSVLPGATLSYTGINPIIGTLCWTVPTNANSINAISLTADDGFCPIPAQASFGIVIEVIKSTYASPDVTICLGDSTNISAQGGNTFTWAAISGPPIVLGTNFDCDTCRPANAKPISTTVYEVTSDLSGGCKNKDTMTVTVGANFNYNLTQSAGASCKLDPIQFDITPLVPDTYTYTWSPAAMLSASNIPNPILNPTQSGLFNYAITTVNSQGCTKFDTISVFVSNGVKPDARALTDQDTILCNSVANLSSWVDTAASQSNLEDNFDNSLSPFAFLNTISGGSIGTGCGANSAPNSMNFNGGGTRVMQTSSLTISNCTQIEYYIRLGNSASGSGCENVGANEPVLFQYSVNGGTSWITLRTHNYLSWITNTGWQPYTFPMPAGVTNAIFRWTQPNHGGAGLDVWGVDDVKISCSSLNNYTYTWSPSSSLGSPNLSSTTAQPQVGTTFQLIVTDTTGGCSDTAFVRIESQTDFPMIDISLDTTNGCKPVEVTFTNNTDPSTIGTVEWDFGDGTTSTSLANPISHNYTQNGVYTVNLRITSPNGCVSDSTFTDLISIFDIPSAAFDANPQPTNISNPNISFYDLSSSFVNQWDWDFGINLPGFPGGSSDQNPNVKYPDNASGVYPVTLIVTSVDGCSDTITKNVTIEGLFTLYLPTSFTPNNDGLNDVFGVTGEKIDPVDFRFLIFDRWGQLRFETTDVTNGWNGQHNNAGDELPEGLYVWRIVAKDGNTGEIREYIGHVTLLRKEEDK